MALTVLLAPVGLQVWARCPRPRHSRGNRPANTCAKTQATLVKSPPACTWLPPCIICCQQQATRERQPRAPACTSERDPHQCSSSLPKRSAGGNILTCPSSCLNSGCPWTARNKRVTCQASREPQPDARGISLMTVVIPGNGELVSYCLLGQ